MGVLTQGGLTTLVYQDDLGEEKGMGLDITAYQAPSPFSARHAGPAVAVAFSPSGRHLAFGLGNGLIAILRTPPAPAR